MPRWDAYRHGETRFKRRHELCCTGNVARTSDTTDGPFRFEHGLYGFPDCHSFVLMPKDRDGFDLLQSTEHEALAQTSAEQNREARTATRAAGTRKFQ